MGAIQAVSLPSPVGGWNARDSIADMQPTDAVSMVNWFPSTTTVDLRAGYTVTASGLSGQCETLMPYAGGATDKLLAIAGGNIYDATTGGALLNYASFPGGSGNYISTPNSTPLNTFFGGLQITAYVAANDWTTGAVQIIASRWNTTGNERTYTFFINTDGTLGLSISTTGANVIQALTTVVPALVDGTGYWLRAFRTHASGVTVFSMSTQAPSTAFASLVFTQIGAAVTVTGGTPFAGTADLEIGAQIGGTAQVFAGKIYSAYVYSTVLGTPVIGPGATMLPSDAAAGSTSWTSSYTNAETWTVNGTAAIVGNIQVKGLSNSRWQYANISTTGGHYLVMVNGADKYKVFDGTAWHTDGDGSPYNIAGVDTSTLIDVHVFKGALWFVQKGTLVTWYLPPLAIGGTAASLDLSSVFQLGGYIESMGTWTLDAGYGVDDYAVWMTNKGEVAVYRLTDPTSVTGIQLIGIWQIGSPIGRRCFMKYRGDNLIICQDGVLPLSGALQSSRLDPRIAITDKIQYAISTAISTYGANFGWQLLQFPKQNMLFLNIPVAEGSTQQQYVMNTITGAWCSFTGWAANCWALYVDNAYFGGNGFIGQAWSGQSDAGQNIAANTLQAFSNFNSPVIKKRCTRIRPTIQATGVPTLYANLNFDFDTSDPTTALTFNPVAYGGWDTAVWDASRWGTGLSVNNVWQGANGIGEWVAPRFVIASMGIDVKWSNTDIVYERASAPTV